ncbi:MAG: hypothetical protein AB4426_22905 [Xenococcaceae cyanobacterium]
MNLENKKIYGPYRLDYFHFNKECEDAVVVLHGFGESAEIIYEKLKKVLPKNKQIIIPNGIFPIPQKLQYTYNLRFAWYFYDNKKDYYFIEYDIPANIISNLLTELKINSKVTFVGFSQGGYLAPFCGMVYGNTEKVITLNASLRLEKSESFPCFPIYCLNGDGDDLVNPHLAKERFEQFNSKGMKGAFELITETKHKINDNMLFSLAKFLKA